MQEHDLTVKPNDRLKAKRGNFRLNCSLAGIKQIFTTWSNPKGNADTERVIRRIKENFIWSTNGTAPSIFKMILKHGSTITTPTSRIKH